MARLKRSLAIPGRATRRRAGHCETCVRAPPEPLSHERRTRDYADPGYSFGRVSRATEPTSIKSVCAAVPLIRRDVALVHRYQANNKHAHGLAREVGHGRYWPYAETWKSPLPGVKLLPSPAG